MSEFPSFDLSGQVALVTGTARGLGSTIIAKALANAGAKAQPARGARGPKPQQAATPARRSALALDRAWDRYHGNVEALVKEAVNDENRAKVLSAMRKYVDVPPVRLDRQAHPVRQWLLSILPETPETPAGHLEQRRR